jgi:hypothetical protein
VCLEGEEEEEEEDEDGKTYTQTQAHTEGGKKKMMRCGKCLCSFPVVERVGHYQSAWHLANLRRSLSKK